MAASLQTPTLFSLATNLTDMQVDTSVDEADAGGVRTGASANFTVTAYPNETFLGTVAQVRISPIVTQNVVTYDAVVAVHDTSGKLLPGMTAQVTISVGKRTHVMAVPIAALLYRPLAAAPTGGGGLAGAFGGGAGLVQSSGGAPMGQQVAGAPGSQVTVWVLQNGRPAARQVVIGLSDGKNVEITERRPAPGDPLVVAQRRGSGVGQPGGRRQAERRRSRTRPGRTPAGRTQRAARRRAERGGQRGGQRGRAERQRSGSGRRTSARGRHGAKQQARAATGRRQARDTARAPPGQAQ